MDAGLKTLRPSDGAWLDLFNARLGWKVQRIARREVLRADPSQYTERIELAGGDAAAPRAAIAKVWPAREGVAREAIRVGLSERPSSAEAELHATLLAAGAPLPKLLWRGIVGDGACFVLLMEYLGLKAHLFTYEHAWAPEQLLAIGEALAQFHAAGMRLGPPPVVASHPWLASHALANSTWLKSIAARANAPPINCADPAALDCLGRLAANYDELRARAAPWQTIVHGDIFWGNVALYEAGGGRWRGVLLDVGAAFLGIPQYDVVYLEMRDWNAEADWGVVRRHHFQVLRQLVPALAGDEALWWWGYRLALVQLTIEGHARIIHVLDQGDAASEADKAWLGRRARTGLHLFDSDFIEACKQLFEEDPCTET